MLLIFYCLVSFSSYLICHCHHFLKSSMFCSSLPYSKDEIIEREVRHQKCTSLYFLRSCKMKSKKTVPSIAVSMYYKVLRSLPFTTHWKSVAATARKCNNVLQLKRNRSQFSIINRGHKFPVITFDMSRYHVCMDE